MPRAGGSRGNSPGRIFNGVGIVGLDEFRKDVRAYGATVQRLLGQAGHEAADIGVARGRAAAEARGGVARHVAPSIRAGYTARYAYVALGSNEFPMALGAEFGAKHDIERRTSRGLVRGWNQFEPWLGNQYDEGAEGSWGGGYFLGPALRSAEADMLAKYLSLIDQIEQTVFNE